MRRPLVFVVVAVVVVVGGFLAFRPASSGTSHVAAVGAAAPGFTTFDLDGKRVRLGDVHEPVLLNFWASWCIPCRTEFPMLAKVNGHGARVLGVVFRDSTGDARAFMRDQHATWPGLLDPQSRIAAAYDVHPKPGIPVTYAIDAAGIVRAKHLGPLTEDDLSSLLAKLHP
ncbi:MAG: cytochrome c biosis protein CcmG, thiol:disulfide interchange protein DsbE [Acidimicrobiaceae bacterium]|nr:cytochrome c biosis protein CcmG, thiol:disulfide interchange protein DsbE [Acidimicrobiaceae bacterium]